MPPSLLQAITHEWSVPFWPTVSTVAAATVYLRGWRSARRTRPRELPAWRAVCFLLGLLSVWLALASPVDALDDVLLVAHMTQHLLLMAIAPPLLLLGCPVVPLLRGLPRIFVRIALAPLIKSAAFRRLQRLFTNPVFGWLSMTLATVFWHIPAAYELALRSEAWHEVEHACFFYTALSFWWFVVRPWPSRIPSTRWAIVPYLITSHLVLLGVATVIALEGHVIYPTYATATRQFGISALADQGMAGGEMVIVGLFVLLTALFPLMVELLSDAGDVAPRSSATVRQPGPPSIRAARM